MPDINNDIFGKKELNSYLLLLIDVCEYAGTHTTGTWLLQNDWLKISYWERK